VFSPLEQFETSVSGYQLLLSWDVVLPNYILYIIFLIYILCLLGFFYTYDSVGLQKGFGSLALELLYIFIATLTSRHCTITGLVFFPLFFICFLIILFSNLLGLTPFSFTLTSGLILPIITALSFNLFFLFYGFYLHRLQFLNVFVPKGVPIFLLPLVVVIEIISYLLRSFSLSVRLFANMMAGHTLLYILSSFVVSLSSITFWCAILPFFLVLGVCFLEIGIAFLQAYVFVVLLSIYVTDSLSPSH